MTLLHLVDILILPTRNTRRKSVSTTNEQSTNSDSGNECSRNEGKQIMEFFIFALPVAIWICAIAQVISDRHQTTDSMSFKGDK